MKRKLFRDLSLWQFDRFADEPLIKHFVTDRNSSSITKEFTLSYSSLPDPSKILDNRNNLAANLGIQASRFHLPNQVHQTKIVTVTAGTLAGDLSKTDALITHEKGICIAVMAADCVSILLYDKQNQAIGAVHSGWRGTVARILEKTVLEMNRQFGTVGKNLVAGIGPSVCQESYEVGEEVVHAFNNSFGKESGLMIPQANGKAKLDLWKANTLQLLDFGVPASQIEVSNLCTVKNNADFFSARKGDTGRFAAGIMLTSEIR